jgi:cell division protein ZapA
MAGEIKAFEVTIMGRQFRVSCAPEEEKDLVAAVEYVDRTMNEIRTAGKIVGNERIAVMAALNIAHELLRTKGGKGVDAADVRRKVAAMRNTVTEALADTQDSLF